MNKDSLIVILLLAVVIGAGVTFFMFSQDDTGDVFVPAPETAETQQDREVRAAKPTRRSEVLTELAGKNWKTEAAPEVSVTTDLEADLVGSIYGKVVDAEGEPIPEAAVVLCVDIANARATSVLGEVAAVATTDAQGAYRINGISVDDRYAMRVESLDKAPKMESAIQLVGKEARRLDFVLVDGMKLVGRVVDLEDRPIPGVEIQVCDQASRAQDPQMDIEKTCVSDANGEFTCLGLNQGMKRVSAQAQGYVTQTDLSVQLFEGTEQKPLEFKLVSGGVTFAGRVVDADDELPLEGVLVRAQPIAAGRRNIPNWNYPPVATDQDGVFTFVGLMPGSYRFRAFGSSGYPTSGTEITAIVPREEATVIKLQAGPSVVGRVIDAATGEPIERFKVSFSYNENNLMNAPSLTQRFDDPKGEFEYRGIQISPQKKEFWLHATAKGYAGGSSAQLLTDGKSDIEGVEILMYKGATATGKVFGPDGKPLRGARVELTPQMGPPGQGPGVIFGAMITNGMRSDSRRSGVTDDDGAYRIEQVPAGWFNVKVEHSRYADAESEQSYEFGREGTMELEPVYLSAGAKVTGRVLDKEGNVEQGAVVQLRSKGGLGGKSYMVRADTAGRFEFGNVRPGIYLVTVTERKGQPDLGGFLSGLQGGQEEIIIGDGDSRDVGDLRP
ncbi:MAG: carboxypeptidase regulatory-like domain-containing protein [Planctomycetes bacterium]|nr:carboxypeptidase regulatory-like domain-containing protein [Planctomycetota bacterium]